MQQSTSSAIGTANRSIAGTSDVIRIPPGAQEYVMPSAVGSSSWLWKPDCLVAVIVFAFGAVFWLPYAVHAYFILDDFSMIEHYRLGTWLPTYRPTFKVAMTATYWLFGQNAEGYYVVLGILMAAAGVLMYVALRALGLSRVPSAIAAVGVLVYPRADSMGLWWSNPSALACVSGLASIALGAVWVRRSGRGLRWLVPCLVLLAASVLSYESFFPIFLIYVCFLPLSPNVRRSFVVIGLSFVVAALSALYLFISSASHQQAIPLNQYAHHAWLLLSGSWQAFVVHGFNGPTTVGFLLVLCCFVLIAVALLFSAQFTAGSKEPWKRLVLTLSLLIVAVPLSLIPFLPSPDYYVSTLSTTGNRVNSLPQIFILAALAVLIWLMARMVTSWTKTLPGAVPAASAMVLALVLFSGFAGQVKKDQTYYSAASSLRRSYIATIRQIAPAVPAGSEIVLANFTELIGPPTDRWYSTIYDRWDSTAIADTIYRTSSIVSVPMDRDSICNTTALDVPIYSLRIPYQRLPVIDIGSKRIVRLDNRAECEAMLRSLYVTPSLG